MLVTLSGEPPTVPVVNSKLTLIAYNLIMPDLPGMGYRDS